jgi:hypothetical protein
MINYIEKGIGLHNMIEESGHTLSNLDGVWVSDDDVVVQGIIDAYTPDPLADLEVIAVKYIEFGNELSATVTAKFWAYHVYLKATNVLISAEDLAAMLAAMDVANRMLQTGALTQVQDVLAQIKIDWPQYTDIVDYTLNEIVAWLATPW